MIPRYDGDDPHSFNQLRSEVYAKLPADTIQGCYLICIDQCNQLLSYAACASHLEQVRVTQGGLTAEGTTERSQRLGKSGFAGKVQHCGMSTDSCRKQSYPESQAPPLLRLAPRAHGCPK